MSSVLKSCCRKFSEGFYRRDAEDSPRNAEKSPRISALTLCVSAVKKLNNTKLKHYLLTSTQIFAASGRFSQTLNQFARLLRTLRRHEVNLLRSCDIFAEAAQLSQKPRKFAQSLRKFPGSCANFPKPAQTSQKPRKPAQPLRSVKSRIFE